MKVVDDQSGLAGNDWHPDSGSVSLAHVLRVWRLDMQN